MLQAERAQEVGHFGYSHQSIDLDALKNQQKKKSVYQQDLDTRQSIGGKQNEATNSSSKVKAIYLEINTKNFNKNFKMLMAVYGRLKSGFSDSYGMRLQAHPDLAKSDQAKETLIKVYKSQKFFLETVLQDYSSSILYLDYIPEGSSLPIIR